MHAYKQKAVGGYEAASTAKLQRRCTQEHSLKLERYLNRTEACVVKAGQGATYNCGVLQLGLLYVCCHAACVVCEQQSGDGQRYASLGQSLGVADAAIAQRGRSGELLVAAALAGYIGQVMQGTSITAAPLSRLCVFR